MTGVDAELASMRRDWGDAYVIAYDAPGEWIAFRRDDRALLRSGTPNGLRVAMQLDFFAKPVPRDLGPGR